jgi:hypothetical protein
MSLAGRRLSQTEDAKLSCRNTSDYVLGGGETSVSQVVLVHLTGARTGNGTCLTGAWDAVLRDTATNTRIGTRLLLKPSIKLLISKPNAHRQSESSRSRSVEKHSHIYTLMFVSIYVLMFGPYFVRLHTDIQIR